MIKNAENMAVDTLTEIWSQIDWDKVTGQRAMGIWDEFLSKVKSASKTTNNYEVFVEKLCRKMDIRSLKYSMIAQISEFDTTTKQEILKVLRDNTQMIVLKLRLNNEIRKEQRKREEETKVKIEKYDKKISNTNVKFTEKGVIANEC